MRPLRRTVVPLVVAANLVLAMTTTSAAAPSAAGLVRINQLGYAAGAAKVGYLMSGSASAGAKFSVLDRWGRRVLTGRVGTDAGEWNAAYPHVHQLDFSALRRPGKYRVQVDGSVSPEFEVKVGDGLEKSAADKAVGFFTEQRDGAEVPSGPLGRKPAHLTDRAASVYDWPVFTGPDTDQTTGELQRVGGPVDVSGGWYDAGDYLKFTHIAAYSDSLLWASARDGGRLNPQLLKEARHGLDWLDKMWDERTKTLYIQVGIGTGNVEGTFVGDHDIWRLPEVDDTLSAPGERFLKNRPVFRAGAPGELISPNLAGRTAAAFALAAQVELNPLKARRLLDTAAQIYAQAKTTGVTQLVTSLPFAFYPESAWRDDLELGAAELALAAQKLRDPRARGWLQKAGYWAGQYLEHEAGGDTFNLYDVSALAHTDLIRAARADHRIALSAADGRNTLTGADHQIALSGADRGSAHRPQVNVAALAADLRAQLDLGVRRAADEPFGAGAQYDNFDAVPHAFGLAATARLYRSVTGDRRYDTFGAEQLDWNFGANPWGVPFMIGVGEHVERCPHHQIANIKNRPLIGAVVNGPNSADLFEEGLGDNLDNMRPCPSNGVDRYEPFTGKGSRYVDDVRSWQSSEPADDFAAIAVYALNL
ncbi:glycoside hydrolase family 9 protein [Kribbella sp. NPDC051770]|uniref:glycoside hydrolase family 9 protein n=1 Tax=Kribbella sp. NPDC051770 TaxID=3155413 RepID=UPI0034133F0B